jgi:hypothetical protein
MDTADPVPTLVRRVRPLHPHDAQVGRDQARLAETLGVERPPSDCGFERFNIAPTQEVLAVVETGAPGA